MKLLTRFILHFLPEVADEIYCALVPVPTEWEKMGFETEQELNEFNEYWVEANKLEQLELDSMAYHDSPEYIDYMKEQYGIDVAVKIP